MREPPSPSHSPERASFSVSGLRYGVNGPYDFDCGAGECIGISGASGVGKSLLLRALADLDQHEGTIRLDGRQCDSYPAPQWRRLVALVPAEPRWWHPTVGEHLPHGQDDGAAVGLAEALGFAGDVLNWQVSRLSTGEKQRLAVLRALVRQPVVLLLDETDSALDHNNGMLLERLVEDYRRRNRVPVLWVSHDREQIERVAERSMVLERNRLELTAVH